ncbi:TBC1 domain family member 5-like isoform X3 [Camellia sinensis]|uniref:TBC1 domain family member 5-like isoform X3 n=1 Tax=Camellia sinensis TaxID=4442 RepID=UPI00103613CB|nr:TBC1 domain family member 5-like isoform X3 [Camellia sinensis]
MVKKRVPDWLNSSLWSTTPPPPPSHPPPLDSDDAAKSTSVAASPSSSKSAAAESKVRAPVPVPPPSAVRPEPPKVEIRDPLTDHSDNGSTGSPSAEDFSRQAQLLQELSRKVVNMGELRRLASQGVPDGAGIRSTVWKLLLGYLPTDRGFWSSELAKKRIQYKQFKDELLMNPSEIARRLEDTTSCENEESNCETGGVLPRSEITHGEHPLSLGKTSIWNQFFQDTEIIEQIDRDVKRTHPDMNFFSGDTQFAKSNQDALRNILIIFAKLNPGIRYVQGMNEILAPLFYVFRNDPNEEYADGFDQRRTLVNHLASMSTTQRFTSEGDCSHNPILGNTPTTCMEGVKWDTVHLWRHFSTPPTRSGGDISKGCSYFQEVG